MGQITTLTHGEARNIADKALAYLGKEGWEANVTTYSHLGCELTHDRMTQTRASTACVSKLKAKHAALTGSSTEEIRDKVLRDGISLEVLGIPKGEFIPWKGGYPVYNLSGVLLGGVGVSELPEERDAEVVRKAITDAGFLYTRA